MSIADTYRAMSRDIGCAAEETDDEGVRELIRSGRTMAESSLRAEGFPVPTDEPVIPD